MIPQFSTAKLIGFGLGIIAVLGFIALSLHWKAQAADRKQQLATICTVARDASNNPTLKCADVPKQITALGTSLADVTGSLERLTAATEDLARKTSEQQREASEASQDARERAKGPTRVSDSLSASSRSSERLAKPCEPSKALQEAWK